MKGMLSVTMDVEIIALARQRYENLSGKIESLVRADLKTVEEKKETESDKREAQLKTQLSVSNAKSSEFQKELDKFESERQSKKKVQKAEEDKIEWV